MLRGTTQKLTFDIGLDTKDITQLWLTFSHYNSHNSEILTKTIDDVVLEGTTVTVELSQEDTLEFNHSNVKSKVVFIQMRALLNDGQALASNVVEITVDHLLKEGVIK